VKRTDLVAILARDGRGSKGAATRALDAFLGGIRDGLRHGGTVTISGFGTFLVTRRAPRRGRNPRTGKAIAIPSARVPRFRPSRSLKAAVR
jgi:DNA-binding protein HU-beta